MKLNLLLLLNFPTLFFCQKNDTLNKIQVSVGMEQNVCTYCPKNDFNDNWKFFNQDLASATALDSSYVQNWNKKPIFYSNINFSLQFIKRLKNQKISIAPRISYSNISSIYGEQNWTKISKIPVDTLSSSQSQFPIYLNSFEKEYLSYEYTSKNNTMLIGLLVEYNRKIITIYSGLEIGVGLNSKNSIKRYYSKSKEGIGVIHYENKDYSNLENRSELIEEKNDNFNTKNFLSTSVNVPLGIKIRLSHKENIYHHFFISYEFRLQRNAYFIPELHRLSREFQSHLGRIIYEF